MPGYAKLFSDIVDSSIWDEDSDTCKVWVTLLALANEDGFIRGSIGWLAGKARVPVHKCQQAVNKFLMPDPRSRTTTEEGRRIEVVDRGWLILNYLYFRNEHGAIKTDPRSTYKREWMRKKRAEERTLKLSTDCPQKSTLVHTASASASVLGKGVQGKGEPTFESEMATVPILLREQIESHLDFAKMVFEAWDGRDGKDGGGVQVRFEKLLKKRWNEEGEQWRNGCHPKQKKSAVPKNTNPTNYFTT